MRFISRRLDVIAILLLGGGLAAFLLKPYAMNGLWFDDCLNGQIWEMLRRFHENVWSFSIRISAGWLHSGRLLWPWLWIYGFFYVFHDPRAVRLADLAFLLGHIALVVVLLRRIRLDWPAIALFVLFLFSLFQIRQSDDPIAAYATFCQVVGIAFTAAALLLLKWKETGTSSYLAASSIVATLSLFFYELNIVYFVIATIVVWKAGQPLRWRSLVIFLGPLIAFLTAYEIVRSTAAGIYSGSSIGQLGKILPTYIKQWIAAFPGSFYFFRIHPDLPFGAFFQIAWRNPLAELIAVLGSALFLLIIRQVWRHREQVAARSLSGPLAAATTLLFLPPGLIAVSARYQKQLSLGNAHLPVYYEYFGLAFLLAAGISAFIRRTRYIGLATCICIAPLFGIYLAMNWTSNMRQTALLDTLFAEWRDSFIAALQQGLVGELQDGDILEIKGMPIFINGNLVFRVTGKRVSIPQEAATTGLFNAPARTDARHFSLHRQAAKGNGWTVTEDKAAVASEAANHS